MNELIKKTLNIIKKTRLQTWILLVIILISIFFRFYNTPLRYSLGDDSTRDAMVVLQDSRDLQLPLLGPFSSVGQFTFGPWYYYQLIFFSLITHFFYAPWVYLGICSVLFVLIIYKIGKLLINENFGLIASLFAAISPPQISSAIQLSNLSLISIFAGLSILLFILLIKKERSYWWSFILGISVGIGINLHYQMAGFFLFLIALGIYKGKKYKYFLTSVLGILVTMLPIFFFNVTNHWYLVKNIYFFYVEGRNKFYVPNRWIFYLRDFWPYFWSVILGVPEKIGALIFLSSMLLLSYKWFKRKLSKEMIFVFIVFLGNFLLLRYYWGERFVVYLQFLNPFIFLFSAFLIWEISKKFSKYLGILAIAILVIIILPQSFKEMEINPFNVSIYDQVIILEKTYPNKKFSIYNCKDFYEFRTRAVSLILDMKREIDIENGVKIGFIDKHCSYPKNNIYFPPNNINKVDLLPRVFPRLLTLDGIDLSVATESAILEANWRPINSKVVSDSTTRWWFREQP